MHNPFIPKDSYISRIADKLEKEEIKKSFLAQCDFLKVQPKDMELFISENIDLPMKGLIMEAYDEFYNDIQLDMKNIEIKTLQAFADIVRLDSENISRMIKKVDD